MTNYEIVQCCIFCYRIKNIKKQHENIHIYSVKHHMNPEKTGRKNTVNNRKP